MNINWAALQIICDLFIAYSVSMWVFKKQNLVLYKSRCMILYRLMFDSIVQIENSLPKILGTVLGFQQDFSKGIVEMTDVYHALDIYAKKLIDDDYIVAFSKVLSPTIDNERLFSDLNFLVQGLSTYYYSLNSDISMYNTFTQKYWDNINVIYPKIVTGLEREINNSENKELSELLKKLDKNAKIDKNEGEPLNLVEYYNRIIVPLKPYNYLLDSDFHLSVIEFEASYLLLENHSKKLSKNLLEKIKIIHFKLARLKIVYKHYNNSMVKQFIE